MWKENEICIGLIALKQDVGRRDIFCMLLNQIVTGVQEKQEKQCFREKTGMTPQKMLVPKT